jgi:hypothetical protein
MLVTFALGLWYGLFAWATFRILQLIQPNQNAVIALAGTLLGVSGVGAYGQTGTTTHEMTTAALMMLSFMLCIIALKNNKGRCYFYIRLAGFVAGVTVGAKLTAIAFAIAIFSGITLLVLMDRTRYSPTILLHFAGASILGVLLAGGYWHYFLWHHYDSPLFPFYNKFIKSPYFEPIDLGVWKMRATTLKQLLVYPFQLSQIDRPFKEEMFSDPRLMLGFIAAMTLFIFNSIKLIKQHTSSNNANADFNLNNSTVKLTLASIWLVAYFVWAYLQGIYRYASFLEACSGIVVVAALYETRLHTRWIAVILLCIAPLSIYCTHYLHWGRIRYGLSTFEIHPPAINSNALVIMLSGRPMSYVIPFFPIETKFVSPQNNFNAIKYSNKLQQKINQTIKYWDGPLYVMAPRGYNFMQDDVLNYFSLHVEYVGKNACKPVISNIDGDAIQICGLTRDQE